MNQQEWLELVAKYEASAGRPLRAFAKEHDVSPEEFRAWVKRVRLKQPLPEVEAAASVSSPDRLDDVLIEAAKRHGGLTIAQVAKAAGVSRVIAKKWLGWLVEERRLVKVGQGRGQRFLIRI